VMVRQLKRNRMDLLLQNLQALLDNALVQQKKE